MTARTTATPNHLSDTDVAPDAAADPRRTDRPKTVSERTCRFCSTPLTTTVVDLGMSPLCESVVHPDRLDEMEPFFPLHVRICDECLLVQLPEYVAPAEIFTEYAYFSANSDSWVAHAGRYAEAMTARYGLGPDDLVVEIASNDGYLLQHFVARGIPVLGVEPAANVAATARERGVRTLNEFFGEGTARAIVEEHGPAALMPANNVLAHVPDINDFVAGIAVLIGDRGVATLEFPHVLRMIEGNQFDTIYHEHYSYLSMVTVRRIFAAHGLEVVDVEELPTHGGSLRVYARAAASHEPVSPRVEAVLELERAAGLDTVDGYLGFGPRVQATKRELMEFLLAAQRDGRHVAGYGAPGKGNTLLNYCGIREDLLPYTVDRNTYKQGTFLPGTHIPVKEPGHLADTRPDYILILPWNLRDEIAEQLAYTREWGAELVVPIPRLEVFST
jgi:C-methyltransferase C-terminal domain/Putative zinc binding domain/Methyltransferase domain